MTSPVAPPPASAAPLPPWLASLPTSEGFVAISEPRRYAFDEAGYDAFYGADPANLVPGRGTVNLLREMGASFDAPALEVGCGAGMLSLGLAEQNPYPLLLLSDASPEFLKITRKKIRSHAISEARIGYAILMGEELDRLPEGELSLVVLRSALHHVLDVERFVQQAARALRPGGVLTFQEPCMEGYMLMGALARVLPLAANRRWRTSLTKKQSKQVREFAKAMSFYARRDLDKSQAEDKHLFRVDELMASGDRCGLSVRFHPNMIYEQWAPPKEQRTGPEAFGSFFRAYAKHCMAWPADLMKVFDRCMAPYLKYVDKASRGSSGPYMHGVFTCQKR